MMRNLVRATLAVVVLAVLTGLVYPLVMTGFAQVAIPGKADGSIVKVDGRPVGSSMIGQLWKGTQWFYGRPSAIDDDASTSSGSNLGPTSKDLADAIKQRVKAIISLEGSVPPGPDRVADPGRPAHGLGQRSGPRHLAAAAAMLRIVRRRIAADRRPEHGPRTLGFWGPACRRSTWRGGTHRPGPRLALGDKSW